MWGAPLGPNDSIGSKVPAVGFESYRGPGFAVLRFGRRV